MDWSKRFTKKVAIVLFGWGRLYKEYLFRGLILCAEGSITSYKGELAPIWGNEQNKSGGFTDYISQLTHILKLNIEKFPPSNYAATEW